MDVLASSSLFILTLQPLNVRFMKQTVALDLSAIEQQRAYLLRYAMLQLRDPHQAEDVVQETLLAAIESWNNFAGQSSLRTWLTGILKHKIMDLLRKKVREPRLVNKDDEDPLENLSSESFDHTGHWANPLQTWANPTQSFENQQFWQMFEFCIQRMPLSSARAFMMREFMEFSTEEICQELTISTTNCWVTLHRARLALRECLDLHWFAKQERE